MKKNMGSIDRIIRAIVGVTGLVVGLFFLGGKDANTLGLIVTGVGVVLLVTSSISWCPPYALCKISTKKD